MRIQTSASKKVQHTALHQGTTFELTYKFHPIEFYILYCIMLDPESVLFFDQI